MGNAVQIDIVILSYAKDEGLKALTAQTIKTLLASEVESKINFNILVIESNKALKGYQYEKTETIYPDTKFGYNRYMNIGIKATNSPYLALCNNDLIFHKGWATNILDQMRLDKDLKSASPFCDITHKSSIPDDGRNVISTKNGILIGWCIFLKREIINHIGYLDEHFEFWYSDNDYGNTLAKHGIKHALVTSSKVTHIGSQTHVILSDKDVFEKTYGQFLYFDSKWNNASPVSTYLKKILLPLFRHVYLNRQKSKSYILLYRLLAKPFGGIK